MAASAPVGGTDLGESSYAPAAVPGPGRSDRQRCTLSHRVQFALLVGGVQINGSPDATLSIGSSMTPKGLVLTPQWCHSGDVELDPYVSDLQRQLVDAAANGADETRAAAEWLAAGLDAATRLVLLDVLSAAASEITRDLAPGSVDLRLRGREIEFVVTQLNTEAVADDRTAPSVDTDDTSTSRTTLRLPDALKARVDEAAAADGLSVNTWLVRAVAGALQPKQRRSAQRALRTGDNFVGWAR